MKIVLFGAGSAQFGCGTLGDIFLSKHLAGSEITLVDINSQALDAVYRVGREYIESQGLTHSLTATTDRKEALKGADFVIISIEVGDRFGLWERDWKIPQQFGVHQVYGENGGPGGIFHALRVTPPIVQICDDIVEICPEATVFNFSNPMTAITTTVLRKHPNLRFIGLCHEIASIKRYVPAILDTPLKNLHMRAAGLNHFSVLLEASYVDSGKDAYGDLLAKASAFFAKEPGCSELWEYVQRTGHLPRTEGAEERWEIDGEQDVRPWSDRRLFRVILEKYGLLPITSDSHLGEYIAWAGNTVDHQGILDFFDLYRHVLTENNEPSISDEMHERVVPIIDAIIGDEPYEEMAVNVMNDHLIPDFPSSVAVEVPARVDKQGLTPVRFNTYPKGFGALIRSYAGVYDLTADAILTGKKDLLIQAVLACPMVQTFHGVERMVDAMLDANKEWLDCIN